MKWALTDRTIVALGIGAIGALVAVVGGLPEVALVVAPWMVLCALGLTHPTNPQVRVRTTLADERVMVGDETRLHLRVSSAIPALVSVRSKTPSSFLARGAEPLPATVDVVNADSPSEVTVDLTADQWGTHNLGNVVVEVRPAYGGFRWIGASEDLTRLRVHPTTLELRELLPPRLVRRVSGTHTSRSSARGVEYADLREFAAGDSVRDINWRATARSNELWVSQRHPDRATDVVLLVDSFVESGHDVRSIFGRAIEAAIALAESHLGATDRVGLIEFGGVVRWVNPGTGPVQLHKLTDALLATGLYANAADKVLPLLSPRALPPRSFVVALTPLLDERFIEAIFLAHSRGHDVAVIECEVDPSHKRDAEAPSADLARRVWDAERSMMRDRMAEQGIAVATWSDERDLAVVLQELARLRRRVARTATR